MPTTPLDSFESKKIDTNSIPSTAAPSSQPIDEVGRFGIEISLFPSNLAGSLRCNVVAVLTSTFGHQHKVENIMRYYVITKR